MSNQLRNCPFCESEVEIIAILPSSKGRMVNLKCLNVHCGASFRVLVHMFNARPAEDRLAMSLERIAKKQQEEETE